MKDFISKIDNQKLSPDLSLSYNLDYDDDSIWEINTVTENMRRLPFYLQEIGITIAYENYYVKRKGLDSYMICYIEDGGLSLEYESTKYQLKKSDVFFIDCKREHTLSIGEDQSSVKCYFIHLNGFGAKSYYCSYINLINNIVTKLTKSSCQTIKSTILQLIELSRQSSTEYSYLNVCNILTNICFFLIESSNPQDKAAIPNQLINIQSFLSESYSSNITLDTLANDFYISKYYLLRQFQKYFSCTPLQYLTNVRITESKKLLRQTTLSITDIAEKIGFNDTSYYIQVFKKQEKITPFQYRKLWK